MYSKLRQTTLFDKYDCLKKHCRKAGDDACAMSRKLPEVQRTSAHAPWSDLLQL